MSDVDTSEKRRRKRWPVALKREIVAATFAPGASVSVVARHYDVNANQVFSCRRRERKKELDALLPKLQAEHANLMVHLKDDDGKTGGFDIEALRNAGLVTPRY